MFPNPKVQRVNWATRRKVPSSVSRALICVVGVATNRVSLVFYELAMARSCAILQLRHVCGRLPALGFSHQPSSSSRIRLYQREARVSNPVGNLNFSRGSAFASGYSALTRKTLDSIMKLESVQHASPEDLTSIWNEYHIGRGHISAVMGSQLFDVFQQRASACPLFVVPVRRGYGYITLLVQAQMPYLLFTGLDDYRARGPDATPFLTVTHYTEFAQTKGLVLVRGDVVLTSKLSDAEAKTALEVAHSFYLVSSRYKIVTTFNKDSREFEFRDVLRELNISAGP